MEEKHHHKNKLEEKTNSKNKKIKKKTIWQIVSAVLTILLILSIWTYGFRANPLSVNSRIDLSIKSLNSIIDEKSSSEVKSKVELASKDINEVKLAVEKVMGTSQKSKTTKNTPSGEKVKVELYVMSQCPFGVQAENEMFPAIKEFGNSVEFNLDFIANDNGGGSFTSLHGEPEVKGDIAQLCMIKHSPDKYLDMISCMNENAREIPQNYESCVQKFNGPMNEIKACYEGEEGKNLLSESIKRANARKVQESPTVYIADKKYSGGMRKIDFMRAICAEFNDKPKVCASVPEPKKVNVILLNDKRCGQDCDTTRLESQLRAVFPYMQLKKLDYNEEEGKSIYKETGIKMLPAVLFDEVIKEDPNYANVQPYLEKAGKYYNLRIIASFDPTAEICDNEIDDDDNGQIDCNDDGCKEKLVCRPEIKKRLDVFVMSQCPFGVRGLDAMKEVLELFGKDIDFHINYIASDNGDGTFTALHGQPEVDENIRELCAIKYYPENYKYMDYIWCRNKNIRSTDWESCVKESNMDLSKMKKCAEGEEGKSLLRENIKIAESLDIGASPTWLVNNKRTFSGIDAETIKTNFCSANPGLKGCDTKLSSDMGGVPSGGCGGG